MADSLLEHAERGDHDALLRALLHRLSYELDSTGSTRDVCMLSKRVLEVVEILGEEPPAPAVGNPLQELRARRAGKGLT